MRTKNWTINPFNKKWYDPFRAPFEVATYCTWGPAVILHRTWFPASATAAILMKSVGLKSKSNPFLSDLEDGLKLSISFRAHAWTWPKRIVHVQGVAPKRGVTILEFSPLNFLRGFRPW